MEETTALSIIETPEELAARSLAKVTALRLPQMYVCDCGLLRVTQTPCSECVSPELYYLYIIGRIKRKKK